MWVKENVDGNDPRPQMEQTHLQMTLIYLRSVTVQLFLLILPFPLRLRSSLSSNSMHTKLHIFSMVSEELYLIGTKSTSVDPCLMESGFRYREGEKNTITSSLCEAEKSLLSQSYGFSSGHVWM